MPLNQRVRLLEMLYDPLPETYAVDTPTGGRHYYFWTDQAVGNSASKLLTGVDIRGDRGYVVAAGSVIRIDGEERRYRPGAATRISKAPQSIVDAAAANGAVAPDGAPAKKSAPLVELDSEQAIARAREWLKRAEPAIAFNGGNGHTWRVAAHVKDFGLSADVVWNLMLDEFNDRCEPPWSPEDLRTIVDNAFAHGKKAIGIASPEAEFGPVQIAEQPQGLSLPESMSIENIGTFQWSTNQTYLVRGLLNYGMIGFLTGLPNTGKSPLALDLAAHIAKGGPWRGMRLKRG